MIQISSLLPWRRCARVFCSTVLLLGPIASAQDPVVVGLAGYIEPFAAAPPPNHWATGSIGTSSTSITATFATLDLLVQPLDAATFNTQIPTVTGGIGAAATVQWNSTGYLTTAPTGIGATVLILKMKNGTGQPVSRVEVEYIIALANNTVATPEDAFAGHFIYISTTGAPNSWQPLGSLGFVGNATTPPPQSQLAGFSVDFPTPWAADSPLYFLWIDDNSATNPDGLYVIDQFSITPLPEAPISVPPGGILETFDQRPLGSQWGGGSLAGSSSTLTSDLAAADAAVGALAVADLADGLPTSSAATPAAADSPVLNTALDAVSTAPTGVAAGVLLASLRNDTGAAVTWVNIEYDLGLANPDVTTPEDGWAGHRIYFSLSGAAGSWVPAGTFGFRGDTAAPPATPQHQRLHLALPSAWDVGDMLYVIWVDDNALTNPDALYTLDNISIAPRSPLEGVEILLDPAAARHISVPTEADCYYLWRRGSDTVSFPDLLGMKLGTGSREEFIDATALAARTFYRVEKVSRAQPFDADSDGMHDVYELGYPGTLNPFVNDANDNPDGDSLTNLEEFFAGSSPAAFDGGSLVVNEVNYDSDTGTDEFVEIYNRSSQPVSLAGLVLVFVDDATTGEYLRIPLSSGPAQLAPGEFLLVAPATVPPPPGVARIDLGNAPNTIRNAPGVGIAIVDTTQAAVIDAANFGAALTGVTLAPIPNPVSFVEGALSTAADSPGAAGASVIRLPNGRDSNRASDDWAASASPTPGAANTP